MDRRAGQSPAREMTEGKCRMVHLGQGSPGYTHRVGDERLESSLVGRALGFGLLVS